MADSWCTRWFNRVLDHTWKQVPIKRKPRSSYGLMQILPPDRWPPPRSELDDPVESVKQAARRYGDLRKQVDREDQQ